MADKYSPEKRSEIMSRVRHFGTKPELAVRRALHRMGYRFRLHRKDLPGKPDIVLPKYRKAIFVHGCFWHGHDNCRAAARPTSNVAFWNDRLDSNIRRDRAAQERLRALSWEVYVVWECGTRKPQQLEETLQAIMQVPAGPKGREIESDH